MIKNILIDIDGTLVDTKEIFYTSLNETLRLFGLKETDKELFGMSVEQALTMLGIEDNRRIKATWETKFKELSEQIVLYPYIKEVLKKLSKRGVKFVVVTSRSHNTADIVCNNSEIGLCLSGCIAAEDTIKHKPNPEPIRKALKKYNLNPEESMYIGDTDQDCMSATHAGIRFGLAAWSDTDIEGDYAVVFKSPLDIIDFVREENTWII